VNVFCASTTSSKTCLFRTKQCINWFVDPIQKHAIVYQCANKHLISLQENAGYVGLIINFKTKSLFLNCEPTPLVVLQEEVTPVEDLCYLGSMISSPLEDLRCRRGMAWSVFWKLEIVWCSQSLSLETKLGLFDSLVLSVMLYRAESWSVSAQMKHLVNSFATSAYRIMTGVKWLYKVRNTTVFASVSRNELVHAVQDRQLRFLGHMLRNTRSPHASIFGLYQTSHGTTKRGHPRPNYVDYVERLTGMKTDDLVEVSQDREAWRELVVACVDPQPPNYLERETIYDSLNLC